MAELNFNCDMMPFKDEGFFWITFTGDMSLGRLAKAHASFTDHPDYTPGVDELLDFSQTSIKHMKKAEIDMIKQYVMERPEGHHNKSVLVVGTDAEYGLARMMGALLDEAAPVDRKVCYEVRDALEWLRPGKANELLRVFAARQASAPSADASAEPRR